MNAYKFSSLVILAGSVLFLIAAFLPISRVFVEAEPEKKMALIEGAKPQWNLGSLFFMVGSLVTVAGLALMVLVFRGTSGTSLGWTAVGAMTFGALLWSWHCIERISSPESFAYGEDTPYLFVLYTILTMAGLIILGIFLLRTEVPTWVAWMLVGGTILLAILAAIFRDMPPFVYYVLALVLAIRMLSLGAG